MTTPRSRIIGTVLALAAISAGCSTPDSSSAPVSQAPSAAVSNTSSAALIPDGFPIGTWKTTITEDDLRAGGVTGEGDLGENMGEFTMTVADDGTWTTAQVADVPLHWPVFKGTWSPIGTDGFSQVTTFPNDYAGDVVNFTWKVEDGSLVLKVVNPPDEILPIVMESHPWQPAD